MKRVFWLMLPLLLLAGSAARAQTGVPPAELANRQLDDPAKEAEASALMHTLRCLVCQGQSIADSNADMASDMRALVRERIRDGQSAEQVKDWLIQRYGDYVTYDPPMSALTAPLWLAPLLLVAIGVVLARGTFRKRRRR
jgi:cytochrome c-type biogenesis protein CcmH